MAALWMFQLRNNGVPLAALPQSLGIARRQSPLISGLCWLFHFKNQLFIWKIFYENFYAVTAENLPMFKCRTLQTQQANPVLSFHQPTKVCLRIHRLIKHNITFLAETP